MYKLVIHPSCPSSKSVVLYLVDKGIIGELEVKVVEWPVPLGGKAFLWSVPLLIDPNGSPLAMDPISGEEVESIITGKWKPPSRSVEEQFIKSVLYSTYGSALALTHRSLRPLLDESFLTPALRIPLTGRDLGEVRQMLEEKIDKLYEENREVIGRAMSIAVVRSLYLSGLRSEDALSELTPEIVGSIILSMALIGRVGIPLKPYQPDMAQFIAEFIRRRARGLIRKIEREYEETFGDEEYHKLVERIARQAGTSK